MARTVSGGSSLSPMMEQDELSIPTPTLGVTQEDSEVPPAGDEEEEDSAHDKTIKDTTRRADDANGTTLPTQRSNYKNRQDRSTIGDWMGWWSAKSSRSSLVVPDTEPSSVPGAPDPNSGQNQNPVGVVRPQAQVKRRRTTKSVFGTLGISVLNPIPYSTAPPSATVPRRGDTSSSIKDVAQPSDTNSPKTNGTVTSAIDAPSSVVFTSPLLQTPFSVPAAPAEPRLTPTSAPATLVSEADMDDVLDSISVPAITGAPSLRTQKSATDISIMTTHTGASSSAAGFSTSSSDPAVSSSLDKPTQRVQGASLRAIVNATRVMTSDPGSVLVDHGKYVNPQVSELAYALVKQARDDQLLFREKDKEKGVDGGAIKGGKKAHSTRSTSVSDAATTLRAVAANSSVKNDKKRPKTAASTKPSFMHHVASPFLGALRGNGGVEKNVARGGGAHHPGPSTSTSTTQGSDNPVAGVNNNASPTSPNTGGAAANKLASVPLESIIPVAAKPPTQYLSNSSTPADMAGWSSRAYRHTSLASKDFDFRFHHPTSASRFSTSRGRRRRSQGRGDRGSGEREEMADGNGQDVVLLTDRYGFVYDVSQYDVLLLLRAYDCKNTAPACLTGVKIADRQEDNSWPGDAGRERDDEDDDESLGGTSGDVRSLSRKSGMIEIVKDKCNCDGEPDVGIYAESVRSMSSGKSKRRNSSGGAGGGGLPAATANSASSVLSVTSDTPRHACANTVRRLLDQLTEIHDQRQAAQRKGWDVFLKQRRAVKTVKASVKRDAGEQLRQGTLSPTGLHVGSSSMGAGGAAAILGMGGRLMGAGRRKNEDDIEEELMHSEGLIGFAHLGLSTNREERKEFDRLVRSGIPLVYRAKVWLECSGGLEMREPGLFQDLLSIRDNEEEGPGSVVAEIEKDVGRTMPLNVFYGGDGVGVGKLRRVLTAYSR